ncbi:MAG: Ig-like domain-containing protein, partial [Butyricicoccaceae bacterium]
ILALAVFAGSCPVLALEEYQNITTAEEQIEAAPVTQENEDAEPAVNQGTSGAEEEAAASEDQEIVIGTASQFSGEASDAGIAQARRAAQYARTAAVGDVNEDFVDQLSENAVATEAYNEMKKGFSDETFQIEDGQAIITYEPVNSITFHSEGASPTDEECNEAMKDVFLGVSAFRYDCPEVFYLDHSCYASFSMKRSADAAGGYTMRIVSLTLKLPLDFETSDALKAAKTEFNAAVTEAVNQAKQYNSRERQVTALHDWLCEKITYKSSATYAHSPYGALVDHQCVCEGYAKAMKILCDEMDIPCKMVLGTGIVGSNSDSHMWNYVRMEDGQWYAVDATWDDQEGAIYDEFLLVGSETVSETIVAGKTFSESHVSTGYFTTDTSTMEFRYPTLSETVRLRVTLSKENLSLEVGGSETLTAKVTPAEDAAEVTWTSSNPEVAAVDENGTVTAQSVGTAEITATASNGASAVCKVEVKLPELVTPTLVSVKNGLVKWNAVDYAEGYRVYRKAIGDSDWKRLVELSDGTATSYQDKTAKADTVYRYTVRALRVVDGNYDLSSYNKTGLISVPQVSGIKPSGSGWGQTTVQWNAVKGATGYRVYHRTENGDWVRIATTSKTSVTDKNLDPQIRYQYTVRAYFTENGNTIFGSYDTKVKLITPIPTYPAGQSAVSTGYNTIKVSWQQVTDADGYYVYRKDASNSEWKRIQTVKSTTRWINDSNLTCGKKYTYTVRAYKKINGTVIRSTYDTAGVSATPVPATVKLNKATAGSKKITISWTKVSGASGYRIYRKTGSGSWQRVKTVGSGT